MSEISTRIQAFHDTGQGWDELKDWLASRRYPVPERFLQPRDESDDAGGYTEGTWDEVNRCRNMGLLTDAQYQEILQDADKLRLFGFK
jgi:hypothetical protein